MAQNIKSTFDKPFTKKDFELVTLIEEASVRLCKRHGNEETASILVNIATNFKEGVDKGVIKDTLDYFEEKRYVAVKKLK